MRPIDKIREIAGQMQQMDLTAHEQGADLKDFDVHVTLPYEDFCEVCDIINTEHPEFIKDGSKELFVGTPIGTSLDYFWTYINVPSLWGLPTTNRMKIILRSTEVEAYPPISEIVWKEKASALPEA
jgi:hypothetical protein